MTALSVRAAAAEAPDAPALIDDATTLTWAELAARVSETRVIASTRVYETRVTSSTRVYETRVIGDTEVGTLLTIYACLEKRAPMVMVHARWTEAERTAALASIEAAAIPEGTLAVMFTSGTEGAPKAAALPRRAFEASAAGSAAMLPWRDDDRWLLCLPLAHVGGLSIVTRSLIARRPIVRVPRFDAATVRDAIERHRVTRVSLVPTMLRRLLDDGWTAPPHLRLILLGGAAAPPRLLADAAARGLPVHTTYGMTETCSQVTLDGRPLPGVAVRIVDGAIQVRGDVVFSGYLRHPAPFTDDGWLITGDLGELDGDGRLVVHARRTDLIITGGENVYPAEVEAALLELPGVRAACVFGVPDEVWGQRVAAALVGEPASLAPLAARLAPHKRPRALAIVDELPLLPSGKVDRAAAARLAISRLKAI